MQLARQRDAVWVPTTRLARRSGDLPAVWLGSDRLVVLPDPDCCDLVPTERAEPPDEDAGTLFDRVPGGEPWIFDHLRGRSRVSLCLRRAPPRRGR